MGIFGTKWGSTISFDTSNRDLTLRYGIFISDKISTIPNIEMFRVIANTENEFVFSKFGKLNQIKDNSFAYLFNCTTVGRTSD